ncbi:sulfatase [Deinococcus deserti]|uniref:Putative sulfatase n=1 Tax=Deinococcus deserti (strain DSM 17065 / CIP 109153 / LMG 22923 / VCD115) TaxID=546414 RepID=C1D3F9_DEIDV|nr:sulfatase [Deinococcus deserti]ACO48038.1 putative sulfatase [Deinococcus deserti VCD115]
MNPRPNILLINCHDLGTFLGCYGIPTVHTPHIDGLASDGVKFDRMFCVAPQCSPSRAALFTGRYPHNNGVMGLTHAHFAWDLHAGEQHLAQILRAAGYHTALVGVHHELRHENMAQVATRCGFDEAVGEAANDDAPGDVMTERALDVLRRQAGAERPFYLQLGYYEPHRLTPKVREERDYLGFIGDYIEPDDSLGLTIPAYLSDTPGARAETAELQGAVRYLDACVGRVLQALRDLHLEQDTLVIFTTDHGLAFPRAKGSLYDPGLEIAFLVRYPARGWAGGRVQQDLLSNVDVVPTLLELLDLPVSPDVQGQSFLNVLDGAGPSGRTEVFSEITFHDYYDPRRAIRTEQYKLIVNFCAAPAFMNTSQSWRPRIDTENPVYPMLAYHPPTELYDLHNDPLEYRNLADEPSYRRVHQALLARLHAWMHNTQDPLLQGAVTSPLHRRVVAALKEAETPVLDPASHD